MKAKHGNLMILYINDENGFNEVTVPILIQIINSHNPDYYEFLNPGSFLIYWKATTQKQKKYDSLLTEVKDLIKKDDRFKDTRVGTAKGEMVFQTNWLGRIMSSPMGRPGNDAMKNIIFSRHDS
jgi:hypothetical protein